NEAVTTKSYGGMEEIAAELEEILAEYDQFIKDSEKLQAEMKELDVQRSAAQAELSQSSAQVLAASTEVRGMRSSASAIQSQISQLSKEQQESRTREVSLTRGGENAGGSGSTRDLVAGEFYFSGTGRDLYQGHGVGMSQYGAL